MSKLFVILLLFFSGVHSYSQKVRLEIKDTIPGKYTSFSVDNFGRIYLSIDDVIEEYSPENALLFSTSLKTLRPFSIESSKSFRTLVFDRERSVVRFLDNTLTDISGEIDLVSIDIQQPLLVCESFSGNTFWVFDAGSMRLIKLDETLTEISITENLGMIFDEGVWPDQMREFNDFLYLMVPDKGVAIFDVFGTFIKFIKVPKTKFIDVLSSFLLILTDKNIVRIPTEQFLEPIYPEFHYPIIENVEQFCFKKNKVYFLTSEGMFIGDYTFSDD